jgi:hypothetical protein
VDAQRLLWWRKRLEATGDERSARGGAVPPALTFIPATLVSTASAASVTVRLPGGVCVEIGDPAAVPAAWIAAVVAELGKVAS